MSKNFVSNEDANSLIGKVGERLGLRPKTFTGTHDQWDQLTELQKSEYEYVNFTDDYAAGSMIFKRTLAAGATTVTVEDPSITSEVMIDVYADVFGVAPTNESVSNGVLTLTFPAQQSAVNLKIVVSGNPDKGGHGGGVGGWSPHCIIHSDTGSTVTAVKGSTTVTAEETSTGIFECDLPDNDYGYWTFNGVIDGLSRFVTTEIKIVQRYEINFVNGKTATPVNDVTLLLECAGIINSEITTIEEVLDNSEVLMTIISSNNAMDYMARSTDWATTVRSDETAMGLIGLNNYASIALLSDDTWNEAIHNGPYFESIDNGKNPVMTGTTTPEGEIFGSAHGWSNPILYAFDSSLSTNYASGVGAYVGYRFVEKTMVTALSILNNTSLPDGSSTDHYSAEGTLSYSDDGTNYTDMPNAMVIPANGNVTSCFNSTEKHYYWKFKFSKRNAHGGWNGDVDATLINNIIFYCRVDV